MNKCKRNTPRNTHLLQLLWQEYEKQLDKVEKESV